MDLVLPFRFLTTQPRIFHSPTLKETSIELNPVPGSLIQEFFIIEVNPKGENSADFVRIVKRSGFRVSCYLVRQKTIESPLFQTLLNKIMQVGGNWERAFGGFLIVHLPAAVDFDVDLELQTIAHSNEGNP
jgi:hypothetical protein